MAIARPSLFILILTALIFSVIINGSTSGIMFVLAGASAILIFLHPEIGLAIAFSSGIFKEWLAQNVSFFAGIDFTVVMVLLIYCGTIFLLIRRGTLFNLRIDSSKLPLLLLSTLMIISLLFTKAFSYGSAKTASFLLFNWSFYLLPLLIFYPSEKDNMLLLNSLVVLGTAVSIFTVFTILKGIISGTFIFSYRASFLEVNPISFATWIGSINLLAILLLSSAKKYKKIFLFIAIILLSTALLVANSRGPLLSFFLSLVFIILYRYRSNLKKVMQFFLLFILIAVTIIILLPPQLTDRYFEVFSTEQSQSRIALYTVNSRLTFWKTAIELATENIKTLTFGIGIGGFSRSFYHSEIFRLYPHNIFLEVLCELGLLALILLLWFFASILVPAFRLLKKYSDNEQIFHVFLYFSLSIYSLIAAQFSGDLTDNRRIWFFLGCLLASTMVWKNKFSVTITPA